VSRTAAVRAPNRKAQQGLESRRKILDAASSLMGERGFAGTSISEVSKRSGLPASSIYWHFESKEGLLGAVVEEGAQRWFDELEAEARPGEHDGGVLGSRAAIALEQRPEFLRLMFLIALERKEIDKASLAAIRHARKLALDRIRATVLRRLEAQRVAGAPALADELSLLALCTADGIFIQDHIDPRGTDMLRMFELFERAFTALARELGAEARAPT
jgi:AcrR family transcriptional regulator